MALLVYLVIALLVAVLFYLVTNSLLVAVLIFGLVVIMGAGLFSSK